MATLADRIRAGSDLTAEEAEYLRLLCSSWQVLADLSFSDLLLYVRAPGDPDAFRVCAQLRPFTSQTLYPEDMVGTVVTQPEQPIVERAFREGRIWAQEDPVLVDGVPIRMDAVPVRCGGKVIAVITKEGNPATSRRPGRLEEVYLQAADQVSAMIARGQFPYANTPPGEWPRVSDGLIVLDRNGTITWASPNALSALSRLGVAQNVVGRRLGDLGVGDSARALQRRELVDGEVVRGDTHILLRVMPLLGPDHVTGALVLARDVTELRQRDRVISVKDATIREIHHRVKNNLQTIASLLRLQSRRLHSREAIAALQESVMRIGSIALVHETLAGQPGDVAEFGDVARRITRMVSESLVLPDRGISMTVEGATGPLGAEVATPLAVSLAELLQNAVEHAFRGRDGGSVRVSLARHDGRVRVEVADDGVGMGAGLQGGSRLGLQIVRSLVQEMGGELSITDDGGTRVAIDVPRGAGSEG